MCHSITVNNRCSLLFYSIQMFCSRCVLSFLALYLLLEKISAAVLPSGFKSKRVSLSLTFSQAEITKLNRCRYVVFWSQYDVVSVLRRLTGWIRRSFPVRLISQTWATSLWAMQER